MRKVKPFRSKTASINTPISTRTYALNAHSQHLRTPSPPPTCANQRRPLPLDTLSLRVCSCLETAGIGITPGPRRTADGLDLVFGVNFVGHFELTMKLLPLIQATPSSR